MRTLGETTRADPDSILASEQTRSQDGELGMDAEDLLPHDPSLSVRSLAARYVLLLLIGVLSATAVIELIRLAQHL
jgi:hypothetical protein